MLKLMKNRRNRGQKRQKRQKQEESCWGQRVDREGRGGNGDGRGNGELGWGRAKDKGVGRMKEEGGERGLGITRANPG
jgi:hypothetical protein